MTARRAIEPDESETDQHPRRARGWIALLVSIVVLVGGGAAAVVFGGNALRATFGGIFTVADYPAGSAGEAVAVTIPKGSSITKIGQILADAKVVASAQAFVNAAGENPEAATIQAGTFRLRSEVPASEAVTMLLDPANVKRSAFTLREGGWLADQVAAMAKASGLPAADFETALKGGESLPKWAKGNPEGTLFPDTYELPNPLTAPAMIKLATDRFAAVAAELDLEAGAKVQGLSTLQLVTLASIVEREAGRDEDRPKVARVIYNRLAKGMPLQLDSTVAYAAGKRGTVWTSAKDRASDSPYNTYKHKGLPPGPIGTPGKASLQAALQPAEGNWLYFVPVNLATGETRFSDTYAEHTKAVNELHAWCAASAENKAKCA